MTSQVIVMNITYSLVIYMLQVGSENGTMEKSVDVVGTIVSKAECYLKVSLLIINLTG